MTDQRLRMRMLRRVALQADNFYDQVEELGWEAALALTRSKRSQITNLESIANSSLKVTDVYNYIKTRTARDARQSNAEQKRGWHQEELGVKILNFVEVKLQERKENICKRLDIRPNTVEGQQVHLLLIREFVRQLAAHYEYACEFPEGGGHR